MESTSKLVANRVVHLATLLVRQIDWKGGLDEPLGRIAMRQPHADTDEACLMADAVAWPEAIHPCVEVATANCTANVDRQFRKVVRRKQVLDLVPMLTNHPVDRLIHGPMTQPLVARILC